MATQIPTAPRIQRLQSSSSDGLPSQRINIQAPDNSASILNNAASANRLIQTGANVYEQIENQKISNINNTVEQEFTSWNNNKLKEIRSIQGDPTEAYAQYDVDAKEKYDSILANYPDMNDRVRGYVTSHLGKVRNNQNYQTLKQRGAQQETYENNLFESTVNLKRNNLAVNAGHIQPGNPGSYLPFDDSINDLKTAVAERFLKKGNGKVVDEDSTDFTHMYRNAEGNIVKIKMDAIGKQRLAKELSRGVSDGIKAMVNSGYAQGAKETFERYKGYIDPRTKVSLTNKFTKDANKNEAKRIYSETQGSSPEVQKSTIDKIKDPDVKLEYLKYKDAIDSRMERDRKRRSDLAQNSILTLVQQRQDSGNPYSGVSELEDEQVFKEMEDFLTPKGRRAVQEAIKSPKNSTDSSLLRVQNLYLTGEFDQLSPEQLMFEMRGLNRADRTKFNNLYLKEKGSATPAAQRAVVNLASKQLEEQLLSAGTVKKNGGKFTKSSQKKLAKLKGEMIDYFGDNVGNLNHKEARDKVKEFVATQVKEDVAWYNFWSSDEEEKNVAQVDAVSNRNSAVIQERSQYNSINDVPLKDVIKFKREYKMKKGRGVMKTDPAFLKFINTGI